MPKFNYVALDARGQESAGVLDARDLQRCHRAAAPVGIFPDQRHRGGKGRDAACRKEEDAQDACGAKSRRVGAPAKKGSIVLFQKKTIKPKTLMIFTRQLATLIDAGLPLLRGLMVLAKQEKDPGAEGDHQRAGGRRCRGAAPSPRAWRSIPKIFNKLYINMVKAGELGGVLELVLNRLAEFQEKAEKIKNKVVAAMFYPVVVIVIAMLILCFLLVFIVPKFQQIFNDMLGDKPLPGITQFVINASRCAAKHHWYYMHRGHRGGRRSATSVLARLAGRDAS